MNLNNTDDVKKIIRGCRKGERKYQEILHKALYSAMFKVCLQYAKDKQEAESFLYDGFLKLYESLDKYTFKGSFGAGAHRLFINNILDTFREDNLLDIVDVEYIENIGNNKEEEKTEESETINLAAEVVIKALQKTSRLQRSVFSLYVIEGLSHKEVAKMLNIKEVQSKSYYYKCKQSILRIISKDTK